MPDVLQIQAMLWHSWMSLSSQVICPAQGWTRAEHKRKRSRESARGIADAARRKQMRTLAGAATSSPSTSPVERNVACPHPSCFRSKNLFAFDGVFSHLCVSWRFGAAPYNTNCIPRHIVHQIQYTTETRKKFQGLNADAFRETYMKEHTETRRHDGGGM